MLGAADISRRDLLKAGAALGVADARHAEPQSDRSADATGGVEVPNLSRWRRSVTGDMTSTFNFAARPDYSVPKLPRTSDSSPLVTTGECVAKTVKPYPVPKKITMPRQRPGRAKRPSGLCGR